MLKSSDPENPQKYLFKSAGISALCREQVNTITAFVDASNIYGSEEDIAQILRTGSGKQ